MMTVTTSQVNDNISISYIPMTKLKTTSVGLYIHRALDKAEASMNALLPFVLKRGCALCPDSEAISKYLENLYGGRLATSIVKLGNEQLLSLRAETVCDRFTPHNEPLVLNMLKLMLSVIFDPKTENGAFNEEYVAQEKKNAIERIRSVINDKILYAATRCGEEVCRGDVAALSAKGSEEGINAVDAKSLYEHYKSIITSSKIEIYICGSCDIEAVKNEILSCTQRFEFTPYTPVKTDIIERNEALREVTEKMDVNQGKLSIGFLTHTKPTDSDIYALKVFNSVFGAGAHSKLFNNVREKLSLAYYASSMMDTQKGIIIVNAGIEFENFKKAYDETLAQLEEIQKGNISELEFVSSINAIVNAYVSAYDDPLSIQSFLLGANADGTTKDIDAIIEKIKNVTVEDVVRVSKKLKLDTVYFLTGKEGEENAA